MVAAGDDVAVVRVGDGVSVEVPQNLDPGRRSARVNLDGAPATVLPGARRVLIDLARVILAADGTVAAAGVSREAQGSRLVVDLKGRLKPGAYTALVALALGDNLVGPEVATAQFRVDGAP